MNKKYCFTEVPLEDISESEFYGYSKKPVLTTKEWLSFVKEDSHVDPVILRISENGSFVGFFSGFKAKKYGVTIIGSPFSGWSTPYMGLDVEGSSKKVDIIPELIDYLKKTYKALYIQIGDREITFEDAERLKELSGYNIESSGTLELSIDMDDEHLYKQMKTDCRNFINQFTRRGARVEEAVPDDAFAEEYYKQLKDVFAKQQLVPTYSVEKVKCLLKNLSVNDRVLCLKVISPENKCIATGIFPGFNHKMFFWGGASYREDQQYRPNEYMIYTAMKYWRDKGCKVFDMVGIRPYKKKFGAYEVHYPSIVVAKYSILITMRKIAAKLYYFSGSISYKLHHT